MKSIYIVLIAAIALTALLVVGCGDSGNSPFQGDYVPGQGTSDSGGSSTPPTPPPPDDGDGSTTPPPPPTGGDTGGLTPPAPPIL